MKVVGYVRVSTDRQADEGLGLDLQREAIKVWVKAGGHRLMKVHADEGISGSSGLDARLGLADAFGDLRAGRADAVVVYRLDRLARDLVLQEQLLAEVRRMSRTVCTTSAGEAGYLADDPNDPSRRLIRQILGAVNEYERHMIRLRLGAGRRRKAEQGGFAYGSPPFGSRAEGKTLVPDEDEQAALVRILDLRRHGTSLTAIAAILTEEGHRPKRSTRWHVESLRRVIARS
jgi:DNA invertase Pin-like site-specific DNA recombinase